MSDTGIILSAAFALYFLAAGVFLLLQNRNSQATLAWMFALLVAPGMGLLVYVLFGRERKAFSKRSRLLRQDLDSNARPLLAPLLARQDAGIARLETRSASHRKLMLLVRRNSHSMLTTDNAVEIQQNATTFYPSLLRDLEAARHSIHLQYFVWAADRFTDRVRVVLSAKARAGVAVRLLYDPLGSRAELSRSYIEQMQAAGVQMVPTSPLYRLHTVSYRNHRKITVIDGAIGYVGGMNMGQEHLDGGPGFDCWRDTQVRIVGEAAAALQAVFAVDWYNATQENLFSPAHFREPAAQPDANGVAVQILTSGPDSQWAAIRQLYFFMIASAQRHVFLQSPYFVLDASIAEVLKSAALAGIDVQVMLSARPSGNKLPAWAGNTYIADAVKAGVRVFLYNRGYLHAKTIAVDSAICSIGSANLDIRSFSINYELNAVLYNEELTRERNAISSATSPTAPRSISRSTRAATSSCGCGARSRGCSRLCFEVSRPMFMPPA